MKKVLLIDGDVLVYKTAFAAERVIDWGDDLVTLDSDLGAAKDTVDQQIEALMEKLEADSYIVALTCHETVNFRKEFYPRYKENRTEKRKPICWKGLREHLMATHDAKLKPNLEADDVIGILATMKHNEDRIICSIDKDFKTIPGKTYNLKSGELAETDEAEADLHFMIQTLTGDSTDNYPGCQGIGPKRAKTMLEKAKGDPRKLWEWVVLAFIKSGFGAEYALTQARCARILRASDYDFKTKKPILWSPPA